MKLQLTLGKPRTLSRTEAWGCFTANLAVPGSGSLAAGRPVGYLQLALTVIGFITTLVCGAQFFHWYFTNTQQFTQLQETDPEQALLNFWVAARGSVAGFAIFGFALAWGAITGLRIVFSSPKTPAPPRIP